MKDIHEKALENAALSEGYNALQAFMRLTTQKASECAARGEATMSEDEYTMLCIVGIEKIAAVVVPAYLRALLAELPDAVCLDAIATALANDDRCAPIQRALVALAADPLRAVLKLVSES